MKHLTMLHWEKTPSASYTYGSKIDYLSDGSITFSNILQAPGTPLHEWQNLPATANHTPHNQIPLLTRGQTYAYHVAAEVEPKDSIAVNVSFMDENDHIIKQHYGQYLDGEFTMPIEASSYRIELLNINNTKLRFFSLFLAEAEVLQPLIVHEPIVNRLLHVHNDARSSGREIIIMRQRIPAEFFSLSQAADQYFLRVPALVLEDDKAMNDLAQQVYQAMHVSRDVPLHWRTPAYGVATAMKLCHDLFENNE